MKQFLIIPDRNRLDESLELAGKYGFGFEYNDFFYPDVLDDTELTDEIIGKYQSCDLPEVCTMHGDFFDVIVFSQDRRIREISEIRIRQSLDTARRLGVTGTVFHTNQNPAFRSESYVSGWLKSNISFWGRILPEYSDMNIYIENMCDSSPDMLGALARELSVFDNFGVCLDYAHAEVFGGGADSWVEQLAPYTKHMHINDNDLKEDLHLAVGDGRIDWERFRGHLDSFGDITVLIETSDLENQRRSAEYLTRTGILL